MTSVQLMDDLAAFLREINEKYFLMGDQKELGNLKVYAGALPIRGSREETKAPCIEVAVLRVEDDALDLSSGQSLATVRLYFETYSENKNDGWREIYNFVEHNRLALLKHRTIARKYRLLLPMSYYFPEPEVQAQMYPQYVGFIEAKYIVAQPKEVIPGYDEI